MTDGMIVRGMGYGPAQRPQLTCSGQMGQMLADVQAGSVGRDRLELAPNPFRCLRLHVEAFVLG